MKIYIKLYFCFSFLLSKCVPKEQNYSSCNCVLLQSCVTFNKFIDNSSDRTRIKTVIQNAVCFFDGFSIFVCCPEKLEYERNVKARPKLDYLDELTGLNCPPSFGEEYNYDEYLKTHIRVNSEYDGRTKHHHEDIPSVDCDDSFDQHHHDHHHKMNVPFFPNPNLNKHNHDYPTQKPALRPDSKKHSSCGILLPVVNSSVEVYPWIIRLAYLNTTSRTIRYRCMGTIIGNQHILTAAHCVDQLVQDLRLIYIRIGDDTNFEDYQILETIIHPNYNEPLFNNDVAILRLLITPQHKGSLMQICLPENNIDVLSGDTGVVAGWSSNGSSDNKNSTIRYISLPIMNNTECAIRYAKYSENFEISIVITPTEFCAKAEAMTDVCEGDSGGPFMVRSKTGRYTLLGIVAFGPKTNCGQSNLPGVYMRVSSYVAWIQNNIK